MVKDLTLRIGNSCPGGENSPMTLPRLLLFDIDQTLILSAGCGRRAFERAFREFFSVDAMLEKISMNGKTDTSILAEALAASGFNLKPDEELLLWERYVAFLEDELGSSTEARVNPGILEILAALEKDQQTYLGLLTGNIYKGAKTKLSHFGLWDYFPSGGFGNDNTDRNIVAQVALNRCSQHFEITFEMENVYVIGDSLRDISCAEAIKAKCVAVATGLDSYQALKKRKPFALFADFSDPVPVLSVLQGKVHSGTNPIQK